MNARVSTMKGDADSMTSEFDALTNDLKALDGFERAYLLVRPGEAIAVTVWESEDALNASAEAAKGLRARATDPSGSEIVGVESYEIAIEVS